VRPAPADAATSPDEKKQAANKINTWVKSEHIVLGCLMATAGNLHRETILRHQSDGAPMWTLYTKICNYHQQRNASQRHEAWMRFLAMCKSSTKNYMTFYHHVESAYDKILRITLSNQMPEDRTRELVLFAILSGLPHDDLLRMSLSTQKDVTLADVAVALLHFDTSKKLADNEAGAYLAQALCWLCGNKDHLLCDCPHREAIQQLVSKQKNSGGGGVKNSGGSGGNGKGKGKGCTNAADATTNANGTSSATSSATSADATKEPEHARVATLLLSNEMPVTHAWLCDTGASSSMSGNRSAFRHLTPDRRLIRLADGKVIYSQGLGSIHFLSDCGYIIRIDDILFVPDLSVNLFAMNKFTKVHQNSHSEVTDYPKWKWINRLTGAVDSVDSRTCSGDWLPVSPGQGAGATCREDWSPIPGQGTGD